MATFQPSIHSLGAPVPQTDSVTSTTVTTASEILGAGTQASKSLSGVLGGWTSWLATPVAFALSYDRNQSLLWAIPTAIFIPRVYLLVRGTQYAIQKVK